jgi:hypothetical protein
VPTQLTALCGAAATPPDIALTTVKPPLNFNGGKGQKSYMAEFHRNVTLS